MRTLASWFHLERFKSKAKSKSVKFMPDEIWQLKKDVEDARKGWHNACRFFHYVVEPDEIEYAIYHLKAAEQRYVMLIRKAKAIQNVEWPASIVGESPQ
ncbi:hypothetical protein PaecuDRAFT_3634 [Paenibacillus curdlanolyticus YK9]|uniref:DUF2508 family protein n=1 Tax=Paenibacillus curdlanolyticus YK9 TaxID=717606 RepID=E0IDD0_9BACL|nr:DUF2508 family protein [Paenibacillus curdlanolyticus]EFM09585.1 hypothetical protein PaecuDRAFT_3634 [Paenibacillus curdlanolyticus YK9]